VTALFGDFAGVGNNIAVTMASTAVTTMGAQTVSFSGDDNFTLGATNQGRLALAGTNQLLSATGSGAHTIGSTLRFGLLSSTTNVVATISNASTGVLTLQRVEGLGSSADHQLIVTGSGNTVFSTGVFNPGGGQTFSVDVVKNGTGSLTFSANAGAAINQGITINGGAVVLGAASTHTGGTTVNSGGRLVVGAANAISASNLVLNNGGTLQLGNAGSGSVTDAITNNGTVTFNFAAGTTVTNVISGSGQVLHDQGQRVTLSASNAYSGGTRIASSGVDDVMLAVSNNSNLGDVSGGVTLAGTGRGTLRLDGAGFSSARNIVLEGSGGRLAVGAAGDTALFSGSITGAGGLTAGISSGVGGNTNGVITLSGALSYSGPTAVAFGSLVLSNAAGTTNALTGGFGTGSGALIKDGAGVLQLSGSNAATGSLTIRGGAVRVSAATNLYGSGNITMTNASVLEATENFTLSRRLIMGSATGGTNSVGVLSVAAGRALTVDAGGGGIGGVGQMVKTGSGTLILASSNSINNGISTAMLLEAGTLVVTNTGTLGNQGANVFFAMNGGALDLGTTTQAVGGFTVNAGTVSNGTISNSGTYNMASGTVSAALTGATANLSKTGSGTLTLSGNNTYGGLISIQAGTLALASTTGSAAGAAGGLTVANNATLLVSQNNQVNDNAAVTLSGGTIHRGSGVSEVFGSLTLTTDSFLEFSGGAGGTIEFSGLDYTPSALLSLEIVNFTQGNTLIIRNTSNWASEIDSGFTFSGTGGFGSSSFDGSTFTITAIPEPSTYMAAAGLMFLILLSVVRHHRCGKRGTGAGRDGRSIQLSAKMPASSV
jgi:autotransporter-associated beta strand protein